MHRPRLVPLALGILSIALPALGQTLATAPSVSAPPKPAAASADTPRKIERFLKIRTPGSATIARDGTLYVRDWPDGIFQVYRVEGPAAKPGVPTTKLTNFPDGVSAFDVSPDGTKILLLHAVGGNENTQISLLEPKADGGKGRIVPLLRNPKARFEEVTWLNDSRGFLYSSNDESPNDFHVYRFDLAADPFAAISGDKPAGASTKLLAKPGSWAAGDITADGSRVLVGQFRSASDTSLFELSTKTGALTDLTPKVAEGATVAVQGVGYAPGEQHVLYIADVEDGMPRLFQRALADGTITKPIPAIDRFELDGGSLNRERTLLAIAANEDGFGVPHLYRVPGFTPVALPAFEPGVISIGDLDGNRVIAVVNNARTPGLAFTFNVPDGTGATKPPTATQITFAADQGVELGQFPLPKLVKFPSFDGKEIPAFMFLPPGRGEENGTRDGGAAGGVPAKGPIPFIVNYHGGPEGQSRPMFNSTIQYLLSEGFGVLQPNVRGSSGYGRSFLMADDYKKRWDSVRDGVAAAEWLVRSGYAAPGRIATYGGSYGGYMSMACLVEDAQQVQRGERKDRLFGAGVDIVGVVNLKTFLEKTAGYRRKLREVEYGPLSDPEFLASVSPMTHIDQIQVPVFIAHGFNDPRVPVEEAMQLAVALKDRGLSPQVFIAPDEGHGFAKLDNRLYFAERVAAFLRHTIGSASPSTPH